MHSKIKTNWRLCHGSKSYQLVSEFGSRTSIRRMCREECLFLVRGCLLTGRTNQEREDPTRCNQDGTTRALIRPAIRQHTIQSGASTEYRVREQTIGRCVFRLRPVSDPQGCHASVGCQCRLASRER